MSITPVTGYIDPNEKCWAMVEVNVTPWQLTKGGKKYQPESWSGRGRWRIAWVNRGDALAEYHERSPHPATVGEVRIPSLWEHTYAELAAMADNYATGANGAERDAASIAERQAESTLLVDFMEQIEDRVSMVKNRSVFGPAFRRQRDGFPDVLLKQIERRSR